jgi:lysozyme family protein
MREVFAKSMTLGGSGTAVYFGWDTFAALCGVVIAAAGLGLSWYFQRKRDRREQEAHDRRMAMFGEH